MEIQVPLDSCVVDVGVDGLGNCKYRFSFSWMSSIDTL